ncbi:hypothetical protein [Nocardioides sp.]|uniref:hypothetical protein n=1 Tax=Nocardioides sp. TaxID=35761 RepID=UPI003528E271
MSVLRPPAMLPSIARSVAALLACGLAALLVLAGGQPAAAAGTRGDVDHYLDQVADRATKPGVYVDPAVLEDDLIASDDVTALTRQAVKVSGPVRVMVLPVDRLTVDKGGHTSADLAYRPAQLVRKIADRIDRKGTYAVLVTAPSRDDGASFYALQVVRGGPSYDIGRATSAAIDCCSTDAAALLRRFLKEADHPLASGKKGRSGGGPVEIGASTTTASSGTGGPGALAYGGIIALIIGIGAAGVYTRFRSTGSTPHGLDDPTAEALRGALTEEVEELRQRAKSLGPAVTGDREAVDARVEALRRLLDQAAGRAAGIRTSADAQSVARTLADARYEYAAATALRDGRPEPTRTPPCFVDPRHGLSVATMVYPSSDLTAPVPVCATCRTELAAGQQPRPRLLHYRGAWTDHWRAAGASWVYLHGYWAGQPFMHQHFSMPPPDQPGVATAPETGAASETVPPSSPSGGATDA